MRRWMWAGVVVVLGVGFFLAALAWGGDPSNDLETSGGSTLAVPDSLPEWSTTTTDPASPSTTIAAPTDDVPVIGVTGAVIPTEEIDVALFVDSENGSDGNDGLTETNALATITRAVEIASDRRVSGESVRVVVGPGVYRETVEIFQDPDDAPPLIVEAAQPGTAVVSGADLWSGWVWDAESEAFTHAWPHDWLPAPDVEEIVGRREIVVVEGVRLEQVTDSRDLTDGTFLVDDASDLLLILPPAGSPFSGLSAEVAVRERTLNLDSARNVVIRGFVFQHAANPFESSGVRISNSRNVLFEGNSVVENSWTGLGLSTSIALTIRDNVINENGGGGTGMFQIRDVLFEGNDTSLNNWRGARGDYVGWSIAGIKAVGVQQVAFVRHRAWWNETRGLWLDYDVRDITIVDSSWCHNLTDGLFVEATPGPVRVHGVEACENGRYGLMLVNAYDVSISNSRVCSNADSQIHMNAERGGREIVTDDETFVMIASRDLTLLDNRIVGDGLLMDVSIPQQDFVEFVATFDSGGNMWVSSGDEARPFDFPGGSGTLEDWKSVTGGEVDSLWERDASAESCPHIEP